MKNEDKKSFSTKHMHYDEYFCYYKIFYLILSLNNNIINSKNLKQ
jgi:hypothetical protein